MKRRSGLAIFALLFICYAWFHQGGGWNQNVRFAQVRAMAEHTTFAIDDQLLYTLEVHEDGIARYRRIALSDPETRSARVPRAVSLDLSEHAGHFYPNKPPGTTLLGAAAYAPIYAVESALASTRTHGGSSPSTPT